MNSWRSGTDKMPFRLNIDGLESEFPDARDQTFFGFTNLSFSNGALDSSYLRAKVVTDLLRDGGLPVARTAFVRVFLDTGSGPGYLGLYTMTEVPDSPYLMRAVRRRRRQPVQAERHRRPLDRVQPQQLPEAHQRQTTRTGPTSRTRSPS